MKSSAFATTGARPAAGRHAGPRHGQDWLTAGRRAHGRHAQGRHAPGGQVPGGQVPGGQVPGGQVPGGQVTDRHTGTRPAGAFARRFAVSVGAAAMAAIGLPEVS